MIKDLAIVTIYVFIAYLTGKKIMLREMQRYQGDRTGPNIDSHVNDKWGKLSLTLNFFYRKSKIDLRNHKTESHYKYANNRFLKFRLLKQISFILHGLLLAFSIIVFDPQLPPIASINQPSIENSEKSEKPEAKDIFWQLLILYIFFQLLTAYGLHGYRKSEPSLHPEASVNKSIRTSKWIIFFLGFVLSWSAFELRQNALSEKNLFVLILVFLPIIGFALSERIANTTFLRPILFPRKNLLILRTFGSLFRSNFLIKMILPKWNLIGSTVILASPDYVLLDLLSYLPFREKKRLSILMLLALIPQILVNQYLNFSFDSGIIRNSVYLLAVTASFGLCFVIARYALKHSIQLFFRITNEDELRISYGLSENFKRGVFNNYSYFCTDENWRERVKECIDESDAILADLRGFSKKNRGIIEEIQMILERTPIEKVVFMINRKTDVNLFENELSRIWSNLGFDHPNSNRVEKDLSVYKQNYIRPKDISKIMALLLNSAYYESEPPKLDYAKSHVANGEIPK